MPFNWQTDIRQVSAPCPECGSMYRRGDQCNRCEAYAPVRGDPPGGDPLTRTGGDHAFGLIWDSRKGEYVGKA